MTTTPTTCTVHMLSGPRKGQECGRQLVKDSNLCRYHYNQSEKAKNSSWSLTVSAGEVGYYTDASDSDSDSDSD